MLTEIPRSLATAPQRLSAEHGVIEVAWSLPSSAPRGWMVVGHPHPLFGGAMSNKVTYMLAAAAAEAGWLALRFNFRGVGGSAGQHDGGRAETADYLAVASALRTHLPNLPSVYSGFSFGGFVALRAAEQAPPDGVLTVAPPLTKYVDLPMPAVPTMPWWTIHGADDDVVAMADNEAALADADPPPRWVRVEGAGHFFHGQLAIIKPTTVEFLEGLAI